MQMFVECGDIYLQQHAILSIQKMIKKHQKNANEDIISSLQDWSVEILQQETDDNIWKRICDIVSSMAMSWPDFDYSPLFQLAHQLLESPEQQAIGFCLWDVFLQKGIGERTIDLMKDLFAMTSQALLNDNSIVRQYAFDLIDTLIDTLTKLDGNSDIDKNEEFVDALELQSVLDSLAQYAEFIFKTNTITPELNSFIKKYKEVFEDDIPFFTTNSAIIFEIALNAIGDETIPVNVRRWIHVLIDHYYQMILRDKFTYSPPEESTYFTMLDYTVQLTIAACQEDREEDTYTFAAEFFSVIVEAEDVFDFFSEIIQQLAQSDDICDQQVAILLIRTSINTMSIEAAKAYLDLCLQIGDCDDEIIILACCDTISDFINSMHEFVILVFDQLSKFLIKYARIPKAMLDLSQCIEAMQQSPEYFKEIIEELISNLPQVNLLQAIEILYCVKSCFSSNRFVSPFNDGFDCSDIAEILFSAIDLHDEYRTVVLGCLESMIPTCPELIQENLEAIIQICDSSMQDFLDPVECFSEAACCIRELASYMPDSISSHLSQVIPTLIDMATMREPNIPEMDIENNRLLFRKSKCESIKCLCVIAFEIDEFGDQYNDLLWALTNAQSSRIGDFEEGTEEGAEEEETEEKKKQKHDEEIEMMMQNHMQPDLSDNNDLLAMSADILISGAKLFSKKNFEINSLLIQLFDKLYKCDDCQTQFLILTAIRELILYTPKEFMEDETFRRKIGWSLISCSTGIYPYLMDNQSLVMPNFLRRALFGALIAYSDACCDLFSNNVLDFYKGLSYELEEDPKKLQYVHTLHFLAKVFMYSNLEEFLDEKGVDLLNDIFYKIYTTIGCFQDLNFIDYEILTHVFMALMCLFRTNKEKFQMQTEGLMRYLQYFIQRNQPEIPEFRLSYQTFYLTLITIYELPIEEDAKSILQNLYLCKNMEVIPFIADCLIYADNVIGDELQPILERFSTILFSSESWIFNLMESDTVQFFFNIVTSISQDDLINFCNFNESSCHQIMQNIQMCSE